MERDKDITRMKTEITSAFVKRYRSIVRDVMVPFQWRVLNDEADITIARERKNDAGIPTEKSHALENFRIAAGRTEGEFYGMVFQDSDVYKWLEAAAYCLMQGDDPVLKKKTEYVVDLIADAQEDDGYLDTFFTIKEPEHKYKRLVESHELYCAGHFMEAAVAYYEATGNQKVMDTAKKLADHIDDCFGPEEGKIHGYDGHEEVEIGLLRMYHLLGEEKYLKLAEYFLLERGRHPGFFLDQVKNDDMTPVFPGMEYAPATYFQNHVPFVEAETAAGHAVRQMYLCTAMADLAATTGNEEVKAACERLWKDITNRQMYITGGVGATVNGESFTFDYDLPNDTMYCETCAAVAMVFFSRQMLRMEDSADYADVMERSFYNCALAGMALDGEHFFYVNPLEVDPEKSDKDPGKSHVKPVRPSWLGCACCPPNLARLIASIDEYAYMVKGRDVYVNLYMASSMSDGDIRVIQETDYPYSGSIKLRVVNEGTDARVALRIPGWCEKYTISAPYELKNGYAFVKCPNGETQITLNLEMKPERNYANAKVSEDAGLTAVSYGPLVYCLEGVDNGKYLHDLLLPSEEEIKTHREDDLLGGVVTLTADGIREDSPDDALYSRKKKTRTLQELKWVPYFSWGNRGENEMRVWVRES